MQRTIFIIIDAIMVILLFKEINNYNNIRTVFKCEHCGKLNTELYNGVKCNKCGESVNYEDTYWSHFLIRRLTRIYASNRKAEYKYKEVVKLSKLEILLCSLCILILTAGILFV